MIKMFAGKLGDTLEPCHIDFLARNVRRKIGMMFMEGHWIGTDQTFERDGWRRARREGWRVVPVSVQEISR